VPRLPDERDDVAEDAPEAALAVALEAALEADRGRDIRRGATRTGPHRDDLVLTLDGRALRAYGSAGQQRSAAIGLRILESYALRDRGGASPVLLFDDPFAELDERRARAILEVLGGPAPGPAALGQVVLAVPRAADIPVGFDQTGPLRHRRRNAVERRSLMSRSDESRRRARPTRVDAVIGDYLRAAGLADRVSQAGLIPEWPRLVGPQVAAVTEPLRITADGTLFVAVKTNP